LFVLKTCSYELAGVIAFIINFSFRTGTVPATWLTAIVTPVTKSFKPQRFTDFRPISVTPALSRLAEKLFVCYWLRPALSTLDMQDQFAYRPTGSTNYAMINCVEYVSRMLECNSNVRCILIDFSKAFDKVNHAIVINTLNSLNILAPTKKWVISFLTGRSQITRIQAVFQVC
jgi:Reverse transcriptase (RNA-dependent DNA polymerase)